MASEWPKVTVIVPARPGQTDVAAVEASRQLDYPMNQLEILVARGRQPAVQRNAALAKAAGELIYFLDDDARPEVGVLRRGVPCFADATVQMVGGPNLCPAEAPLLERVFAVVLGSWLAFGPSRARYVSVGVLRESGEKELILCNLMARRTAVMDAGGFDESLYPNEENALMDQLQRRGGKLLHDPGMIVYRRPRGDLRAFCRMLLNYGRGRAEQFRLHPTPGSLLNFVPPIFCLYLVLLPWVGVLGRLPLGLYGLALAGQTMVSGFGRWGGLSLLAAPLIVATHVFYGLGFWRGLFTRPGRGGTERAVVELENVGVVKR